MTRRLGGEGGFAPTEFVLFAGLILLPTLVLVMVLPTWWERQSLGRAAAREAARAVVLAESWDDGTAAGQRMVAAMAANYGVPDADMVVAFSGVLARGQSVTAAVSVTIPSRPLPFLPMPGFTLTATHTEPVDAYRSFGEAHP